MLVLTRKIGEEVIIGDDIIVTILNVAGQQVKMGFEAPSNITVHRREIYERIKAEKEGDYEPAK